MYEIREIPVAEYRDQLAAITAENWSETGYDFPLDFDYEWARQVQEAGAWFMLAAFDAGEIVGYSTAAVFGHPFNPAVVMCSSDALFVRPAYRCGTLSARLIQATEQAGKARGAVEMLWNTQAGTPFAEMLTRRGYEPADVVVTRRL